MQYLPQGILKLENHQALQHWLCSFPLLDGIGIVGNYEQRVRKTETQINDLYGVLLASISHRGVYSVLLHIMYVETLTTEILMK
jgi:hypothetical protein